MTVADDELTLAEKWLEWELDRRQKEDRLQDDGRSDIGLASFQFQKTRSASNSESFHRTGRGSVDWILARTIPSRLSSSYGTATLIASTSADVIGRAR
jgi:hypothetical protein